MSNDPIAEVFDHPLRYWVRSKRKDVDPYLIELDAFGGNGECQCQDFTFRLLPLLNRAITPAEAVAGDLVTLREGWRPEDALRCEHIRIARSQFCDDSIAANRQPEHTKQ